MKGWCSHLGNRPELRSTEVQEVGGKHERVGARGSVQLPSSPFLGVLLPRAAQEPEARLYVAVYEKLTS